MPTHVYLLDAFVMLISADLPGDWSRLCTIINQLRPNTRDAVRHWLKRWRQADLDGRLTVSDRLSAWKDPAWRPTPLQRLYREARALESKFLEHFIVAGRAGRFVILGTDALTGSAFQDTPRLFDIAGLTFDFASNRVERGEAPAVVGVTVTFRGPLRGAKKQRPSPVRDAVVEFFNSLHPNVRARGGSYHLAERYFTDHPDGGSPDHVRKIIANLLKNR
jgi:hypothetical protein